MKSDDDVIKAVITDDEKDRGEHPIGQLVHISTVTHAWRGVLADVTPSYYALEAGAVLVSLTGQTGKAGKEAGYSATKRGKEEDGPTAVHVLVARGAMSWMLVFGRP